MTGVEGPAERIFREGLERVVHGLDAPVRSAANDDVADVQRPVLHDQFRHDSAIAFLLRFQASSHRRPLGIRLVFVQVRGQQQGFQQRRQSLRP